jgi:PAS domain S-box-containing protein
MVDASITARSKGPDLERLEMGTRWFQSQWQLQSSRKLSPSMDIKPDHQSNQRIGRKSETVSDDFLRPIVDACVSNVAVLDESGKILYASKAWRLCENDRNPDEDTNDGGHYRFEDFRRFTESELDEDASLTLADDIERILLGVEKEFHRKYYFESSDTLSVFLMHAARLNLPGDTFRVLITHTDAPAARADFQNSNDRLTHLLDSTKIIEWEGSVKELRFTHVSEQAVRILGYAASTWCEPKFLLSHIHPEDRRQVLTAYSKQIKTAERFELTFRMLGPDNQVVWVQNLVNVTRQNGVADQMHGFMIDISERKRAEEALKDLGVRLITAQEEERKRVARELHDDLNQRMAVLSMELDQLGQEMHSPFNMRKRLQRLQSQAKEISTDIHRLSYKLHPSKLDHLGLAAAVRSLCDEISQGASLRVGFQQTGFPCVLPKDSTLCIFRIAQELLQNCVKHSRAQSAQVVLTKTENAVRLSISDDGCGFDLKSDAMEKGLGFVSMQERLRIVGGEVNIRSQRRFGTRIEVWVPLSREVVAPSRNMEQRGIRFPQQRSEASA